MRLAAIADIHGNDLALEAVLADIDAQGIDSVVNLGDHLSGPLNAARTADMLMARHFPAIQGNHDRWLVSKPPIEMGRWDRAAHDDLAPHHLAWLETLPPTLLHANEILLCHGTPDSDTTYWLEDVSENGTVALSSRNRIEAFAKDKDASLILCGHTHIARAVMLADGRLVVNPGSVGCPAYDDDDPAPHTVETGSPDACYAILSKQASSWDVTFRKVAYDHQTQSSLAARRGFTAFAHALATGWMK